MERMFTISIYKNGRLTCTMPGTCITIDELLEKLSNDDVVQIKEIEIINGKLAYTDVTSEFIKEK